MLATLRGCVAVQKPPLPNSAPAMTRFRRWTHCPPLCQRAGLELAQLRVPALRDSRTPLHSLDRTLPFALGTTSWIFSKDSYLSGAWRLDQEPEVEQLGNSQSFPWGFVRDRLLHHHQLESAASASHPKIAIQPNPGVAHNTSPERKNYETVAFRNRRCNDLSWAQETRKLTQPPHAP